MSNLAARGASAAWKAPAEGALVWLFTPAVDLAAFLGSAVVSLLILAWGARQGLLSGGDTPEWTWVSLILLVDVAHVYSTGFRVYWDRDELRRRPWLYAATPLVCWAGAAAVYWLSLNGWEAGPSARSAGGEAGFWRVLAYFAVFHFVRQQYGWVALYRAKANEPDGWPRWIDTLAIYAATVYPLIYWHATPARRFSWMMPGDFISLPALAARIAWPLYLITLGAYAFQSAVRWRQGRGNPGKDLVVATTVCCWYVGIVAFNSDFAFTVTNVVIHGVPYLVLIGWHLIRARTAASKPLDASDRPRGKGLVARRVVLLLSTVWLLAYCEELLWDRAVWQERPWLFGRSWDAPRWRAWLVPLLATPQLTHYVLDGFIWKRRSNPEVARPAAAGSPPPKSGS